MHCTYHFTTRKNYRWAVQTLEVTNQHRSSCKCHTKCGHSRRCDNRVKQICPRRSLSKRSATPIWHRGQQKKIGVFILDKFFVVKYEAPRRTATCRLTTVKEANDAATNICRFLFSQWLLSRCIDLQNVPDCQQMVAIRLPSREKCWNMGQMITHSDEIACVRFFWLDFEYFLHFVLYDCLWRKQYTWENCLMNATFLYPLWHCGCPFTCISQKPKFLERQ